MAGSSSRIKVGTKPGLNGRHDAVKPDGIPWNPVIPLGEVPPPPPFPVEHFPPRLIRFVEDAAEALNSPVDFTAVPLLATAAGCIGGARAVGIKAGYSESCVLFVGTVGDPGSGKSPGLKLVTSPLWGHQARLKEAWKEKMEDYNLEKEEFEERLKEWKKTDRTGERPAKPGSPPPLRRVIASNATVEALSVMLEANEKGFLVLHDELIGWIRQMDAYRSGGDKGDRQFWLSAWSAESTAIDRKKDSEKGPIIIRRPHVSVAGGLVPSKLSALRGDAKRGDDADGFLDRILLSWPACPPAAGERWATVSDYVRGHWDGCLLRLMGLNLATRDGDTMAHVVPLGRDARAVWERFTADHAAEVNDPNFEDWLRSPWSKLRGYCARLALVLNYLSWAEAGDATDIEEIGGAAMEGAVCLTDYFKGHSRRVNAAIDVNQHLKPANRVVAWLRREFRELCELCEPIPVSLRDIHAKVLGSRWSVEQTEAVIGILVKHNYLRPLEPSEARKGPGRKPSQGYEVNPSLFSLESGSQNSQYSRNAADEACDSDDAGLGGEV